MGRKDLAVSYKSKRSDFPNSNWANWPFNEKVRLFQEQIQGWVINVARDIKKQSIAHADFAILSMLLSYFENISKFTEGYDGKYESRNHFVKGIKLTYSRKFQKKTIELLYDQARNRMYHVGLTGTKVELNCSISCGLIYQRNRFIICPEKLIDEIQRHFNSYVTKLNNSSNRLIRKNFAKRGRLIWGT